MAFADIFSAMFYPAAQAMARVHRIGQTKKVHVYRLITVRALPGRLKCPQRFPQ
jgi:hypothetical protein